MDSRSASRCSRQPESPARRPTLCPSLTLPCVSNSGSSRHSSTAHALAATRRPRECQWQWQRQLSCDNNMRSQRPVLLAMWREAPGPPACFHVHHLPSHPTPPRRARAGREGSPRVCPNRARDRLLLNQTSLAPKSWSCNHHGESSTPQVRSLLRVEDDCATMSHFHCYVYPPQPICRSASPTPELVHHARLGMGKYRAVDNTLFVLRYRSMSVHSLRSTLRRRKRATALIAIPCRLTTSTQDHCKASVDFCPCS